jgi:hypothetical protein
MKIKNMINKPKNKILKSDFMAPTLLVTELVINTNATPIYSHNGK